MSRILLTVNRDFAGFPEEMRDAVVRGEEKARQQMDPGSIGVCYRDSYIRSFGFLPAAHASIYHMLFPKGRIKPIPYPESNFGWEAVRLKDPKWSTQEHALYYHMRWIKELLVDEVVIYHHVKADAFILRPRSLIVLYAQAGGPDHGTILLPEATSGHDDLEELTAIMADFPDRFEIEAT